MQHPNKDAVYILSYPRSGLNWFRYCLKFITNDVSESPAFHDSHSLVNDIWSIENCFDIKNILLLRNYKECTFSELKNFTNDPDIQRRARRINEVVSLNTVAFIVSLSCHLENLKYIAKEMSPNLAKLGGDVDCEDWDSIDGNLATKLINSPVVEMGEQAEHYCTFPAEYVFDGFTLPSFHDMKNKSMELRRYPIESTLSLSVPNHYYFAKDLKRYYDLLEYHDKVSEANANNALVVKYEDMMQNPLSEFNKVIDFMRDANLATSEQAGIYRNNLQSLIDNIEYHREVVSGEAISQHHRHTALSYEKDNKFNIHSAPCRKEFLVEIDDVLKNKNLELFNKYLSDYSESEE